ncbi:MAG: hypothetical protein QM820_27065 [Minicystis sp.]
MAADLKPYVVRRGVQGKAGNDGAKVYSDEMDTSLGGTPAR